MQKCPTCGGDLFTEILDGKFFLTCKVCEFSKLKNCLKVNQIYAFFSVNKDDDIEGIAAFVDRGIVIPLIAADKSRLEELKLIAHDMAKKEGMALKLVKFTNREEMEVIGSDGR